MCFLVLKHKSITYLVRPFLSCHQVRVATWRQRIDPVLSAEEDRSAFDIHDYGGAILERLGGKNNEVEQQEARDGEAVLFQRVVACDNRFEVARMFAAMLQLVNNRCVGQWACVS